MNLRRGVRKEPALCIGILVGVVVALASCGSEPPSGPDGDAGSAVQLTSPVVGAPLEELFYGAYYAHGAGASGRDYQCGSKLYADHRGVDILLRNFVVMDSGVTVVAAAPGNVVTVRDGNVDRNTANGPGGFGNYVTVLLGDGRTTIYGHLRSGSIPVSVGATVERGDPLGLVGSSGNSNWPHLHFEVRQGSVTAVDPFQGPCNAIDESMWQAQLSYQDPFIVLDHGLSGVAQPSLGDLLERLDDVETFVTTDAHVFAWTELFNVRALGIRVDLRDPGGALVTSVSTGAYTTFSARFFGVSFDIAGVLTQPGLYTVEHYHNNGAGFELVQQQSFELSAVAGPAPQRRDPERPPARIVAVGGSAGDRTVAGVSRQE